MGHVKDDFYVEDESPEEVQRSWESGAPVLVMPSRLRRQLHRQTDRLRRLLAADSRGRASRAGAKPPAE